MRVAAMTSEDPTVFELMKDNPETIVVFLDHNMQCVGCAIGNLHTINDVCAIYELEPAKFMGEIQDAITQSEYFRQIRQDDAGQER